MNADSVRKIVALNRQIKGISAMVKSGDLTAAEGDVAKAELQSRIDALRSQRELPGVSSKPGKGA